MFKAPFYAKEKIFSKWSFSLLPPFLLPSRHFIYTCLTPVFLTLCVGVADKPCWPSSSLLLRAGPCHGGLWAVYVCQSRFFPAAGLWDPDPGMCPQVSQKPQWYYIIKWYHILLSGSVNLMNRNCFFSYFCWNAQIRMKAMNLNF